jgi:hypothetical integral membrane protein (TIGR02206 family)
VTPLTVERPFTAYGPSHWAVLGVIAVGAVALVAAGRATRGTPAGRRLTRALAVLLAALAVVSFTHRLVATGGDLWVSLPLHLCDLAWGTAALTLWTGWPWSFRLTYYWGLTLSPIALATPALVAPDFPGVEFLLFWTVHALVVWAAAYLTWGLGMRPDWRGYRFALAATLVWGLGVLGYNALAGTNFGFVSAKPPTASPLDVMGPWPWYLLVELALIVVVWALVTLPWTGQGRYRSMSTSSRRYQDRRDGSSAPGSGPSGAAGSSMP